MRRQFMHSSRIPQQPAWKFVEKIELVEWDVPARHFIRSGRSGGPPLPYMAQGIAPSFDLTP